MAGIGNPEGNVNRHGDDLMPNFATATERLQAANLDREALQAIMEDATEPFTDLS